MKCNLSDYMFEMGRESFWFWFDINRSHFHDAQNSRIFRS